MAKRKGTKGQTTIYKTYKSHTELYVVMVTVPVTLLWQESSADAV